MSPIEIQVSTTSGTRDIVLSLGDDTSVADVFSVLSLPPHTMVDGQAISSPDTTAADAVLHVGTSLTVTVAPGSESARAPGFVDVAVVAGFDAGASARLGSGLFHIAANQVAASHAEANQMAPSTASAIRPCSDTGWLLQVDARDPTLGSPHPWQQHGAHVEMIERGSTSILAVGPPVDPEQAPSCTIHRPPRGHTGALVAPVHIGALPEAARKPSPLSWATLLAPIPVALLMAFFFRPLFALFAAMGPIMALGRWWESRRRYRRAVAARALALVDVRRAVAEQLVSQAEAEAQCRWLDDPHVAALWQRAASQSVRLWERRSGTDGFMRAMVGVGPDRCKAVLAESDPVDDLRDLVAEPLQLRPVPHTVELEVGTGVGVCGGRTDALAIARSLVVQLATLQGPADLRVGVLCSQRAASDWDWLKWLPHIDHALVGHDATDLVEGLSGTSIDGRAGAVARLVVIDAPQADVARLTRAAAHDNGDLRIVALAPDPTELPAVCSTTVLINGTSAVVTRPGASNDGPVITPTGIADSSARVWARQLAKLCDPEAPTAASRASNAVSLLQLVGTSAIGELGARWARHRASDAPVVTLGNGDDGLFRLDLAGDGPHALVAGTTGSGKSELLRSLVVGLAVGSSPEHVNFVLVDFKGGGAFDIVRDLPHVVGVITDLDEALVVRALVSLRAELERRERLFRHLGVSAYGDAVACSSEPIARLVIVIDEFAVLATDYIELMASIIDLAARGRSLGMHLVLATQRPSGVVDQKIRANTNVRIALRVQDAFDSQDVVGVPDAAHIDRKAPGRSIVRIGGDRPVEVQMAFTGAPDRTTHECVVRSHRLFDNGADSSETLLAAASTASRTELEVIVEAIVQAATATEASTRSLWAPPLPAMLDWIDLGTRELAAGPTAPGFALGLADMPECQSQQPWRWDPSTGPLSVYGASGPCAGKVLVSLGAAMASSCGPDLLHLYVVDGDAGVTATLANLPHTGAYLRKEETDRVARVLRLFEAALESRRTSRNADDPNLVLIIDNIAAVLAAHDEVQMSALTDRLAAIARDGFALGVHLVLSARTPRDNSHRLAQQIPNRLALALADPSGYLALGVKLRELVPLPAMRAIDLHTRHVVQLVEPPDLTSWSTNASPTARVAPEVPTFPNVVCADELDPASIREQGTLHIPVGIDSIDVEQAQLVLRPGEHALIVGAPGMGRSTTAAVIARQLDRLGIHVLGITPLRSPLAALADPVRLVDAADAIDALAETCEHTVVVVDDADSVSPDMATSLERLLDSRNEHVQVVAVTTPDAARSTRSWTTKIRAGGSGILIGGALSDGELFRVRLGRLDGRGTQPGRGDIIVRGRTLGVQLAQPNTAR